MTNEQRKGDWMQTASGKVFWPMDPRTDEVCIEDIAHSLSMMCRYLGHTSDFYSVAQHSVLVSLQLPPHLQLWGLLHDAAEAYVVDVPRPIKPFLPGYAEIEARVMGCIVTKFNLYPRTMPAEVKRIDDAILGDEKAALMPHTPRDWQLRHPPLGIKISPTWTPGEAKGAFLATYYRLIEREIGK